MVAKLKAEYQVEVDWRPFYLRPDTPPEGMELPDYIRRSRASGADERLKQIAEGHGMPFRSPDRIFNTRLAHEATEYARGQGRINAFHRAVFNKVFAEGKDIGKWEALREAAGEAGIDPDAMQAEVESGRFTRDVAEQVREAYRIGVSGVPTYVINERYAIVGAQPYEVFQRSLKRILEPGA